MGGGEDEETGRETSKLQLVLAAKWKSRVYTSPASPNMFASPLHTLASVPFSWEEEPGKPKHPSPSSHPYTLELPPRLLLSKTTTNTPLPTSSDHRLGAPVVSGRTKVLWFWKKKRRDVAGNGYYVFPAKIYSGRDDNGGSGAINTNVNIIRVERERSLYGLSTPRSHFWANIYKGLKQVVKCKSNKLGRCV